MDKPIELNVLEQKDATWVPKSKQVDNSLCFPFIKGN